MLFFREAARRVFARELKDSNLTSKDESDQYAPQYLLTPTGVKVNRIFIVGTLIEILKRSSGKKLFGSLQH